ncbi:MAG: hypothetical protein KA165_16275, partial [Saprospiraceae bacterium]|nr:hypothetical protein [Saprospiraceae bacterium]
FAIRPLPVQAQIAPLYGMLPYDFDHDGLTDLLTVGNDFGMELLQGRADAFYGLVLKNTGKGQFKALELAESKFYVPNDARALTRIGLANGQELILATQNHDALKVFAPARPTEKLIPLKPEEVKAVITFSDGRQQAKEFYRGSTFLSQEPRNLAWFAGMKQVVFYDRSGRTTRTYSGQ